MTIVNTKRKIFIKKKLNKHFWAIILYEKNSKNNNNEKIGH